jgi:outer membrane lipoprotein-sorting protein
VRLWPFGPRGPGFTLSPENWLLTSAGKHRVDRSDIGALLSHALSLRQQGAAEVLGEEPLNGRTALRLRVRGLEREEVDGVHRFDLWLDADTCMPLRAEAYDRRDVPVDLVLMDDLELDPPLPAGIFDRP